MRRKIVKTILVSFIAVGLAGCTFIFQKGRRSDTARISELEAQLDELNQTKQLLEERLSKEIGDKQVRLDMMEKGLVITVVGDLLFDSGKAEVRSEAFSLLDKVARVLRENVPENNIGIEGYTDNEPIKHSGWKSNWELSSARALSVLHYLSGEKDVNPERLSAIGYGEYRPVSSNSSAEGRQLNRRVEVVILPKIVKASSTGARSKKASLGEPQGALK